MAPMRSGRVATSSSRTARCGMPRLNSSVPIAPSARSGPAASRSRNRARASPTVMPGSRRFGAEPPFRLGEGDALAGGVVLELVALDPADAEVVAGRVPEVVAGHRCAGQHRARLGQLDAGARLRVEELEQRPLLGVVGACRVAGGGPDALVALRDELGVGQRLVRRVAPQLAPDALVESLGERLGQPVRQRLGEDRRVVVVGRRRTRPRARPARRDRGPP